jgi:hypothetical protein
MIFCKIVAREGEDLYLRSHLSYSILKDGFCETTKEKNSVFSCSMI